MSNKRAKATASPPSIAKLLLFERDVIERCRLSRAQIYKLERLGLFPRRKKYGLLRAGWPAREIDLWIKVGADGWNAAQRAAAA